jgi:phenylacetic acid degradation operon negative regulatory protein
MRARAAHVAVNAPNSAATRRVTAVTGSARSLLLTLLGEFVLTTGHETWTSAIISAEGLLGVEEKAARQALSRASRHGWIISRRFGREARWRLTDEGARLLTEGARRIYSFETTSTRWDGRWLVILVSVPESRRQLRHHLRTQLQWAGFGSPSPGVWLTPQTAREAEALSVLAELGLEDATTFVGSLGSLGDPGHLVRQAWDLEGLAARYQEFVQEFSRLRPIGAEAMFVAQASIVHAWRRFPFIDPGLPREVLPDVWAGDRATRLFHQQHSRWQHTALRHWAELQRLAPPM